MGAAEGGLCLYVSLNGLFVKADDESSPACMPIVNGGFHTAGPVCWNSLDRPWVLSCLHQLFK